MKKFFVSMLVLVAAVAVQAKTINSNKESISPSEIDQVIRLVDKNEPGTSHKKLSIVVTDQGMSTDVSPRYTVYLAYASMAEMGNISVDFKITDQPFHFLGATRKAAGIYEVKAVEARETGFVEVTYTIDATKMFADEKAERTKCGGDFCDLKLQTSVSVTETSKPTKF